MVIPTGRPLTLKGAEVSRCGTTWRCTGTCQLSTIFHTVFLLQRCHSFLSPIMASSNDPFRTPQSTTQAFESGDVRVSDQFVYVRCISSRFFNLPTFVPSFSIFFQFPPPPKTSFNVRSNRMRIRLLQHQRPHTAQ
jgi:hypothetical protein